MNEWSTDRTVIASAIAGDRGALRAVWRDHRRWVAAILIAHKPRRAELDDLLQMVALQLCRKAGDVRDPEAFRPWLRTVAINTARAEGRSTTRRRDGLFKLAAQNGMGGVASGGHGASAEAGAPERAGRGEQAERLIDLAGRLPDGYREPLLMRCLREMSYRQIGEAMDLPETTVETRIARGRRMLRELAAATGPAGDGTTGKGQTALGQAPVGAVAGARVDEAE